MEGAPRPCALLFLLLLSQAAEHAGADAGAMELSGILGGSVTFPLGVPAERFKNAFWSVNTTKNLVTVIAGTPPTVIVTDETNYNGRLGTPENSYSLQLTGLRMEDAGLYTAQVNMAEGKVTRHFRLRVYRPVPEPTILCHPVTCGNGTCNYSLTCTVRDGGENVTHRWTQPETDASVIDESVLLISQTPQAAPRNLTCTAQNPVSTSSRTVPAEDLCRANPPAPASRSSLSYCRVKGLILLLVLGALSAGIIAVHVLPSVGQRRG